MNCLRWITSVFAGFLLIGCGERPQSYESQFEDSVVIDFPGGHPYKNVEPVRARVDEILRSRKVGFWSGVMGSDNEISQVFLELDFDLVNEEELVQSFIDGGLLPADVEVKYSPKK